MVCSFTIEGVHTEKQKGNAALDEVNVNFAAIDSISWEFKVISTFTEHACKPLNQNAY